jgi:HUS1 checkpoint protein
MLSMTICTTTRELVSVPSLSSHASTNSNGYSFTNGHTNGNGHGGRSFSADPSLDPSDPFASALPSVHAEIDPYDDDDSIFAAESLELTMRRQREKLITQDIPVRVLHPDTVETIMQPKVREPDVHIHLPSLGQLKAITDRFIKIISAAYGNVDEDGNPKPLTKAGFLSNGFDPFKFKLELSANMHGSLRLRLKTDMMDLMTQWNNLENPVLDQAQLSVPLAEHPSSKFKAAGPNRWATVRVDLRDWTKVLGVGRLEGRVIACFADEHALILYVYVPQFDDPSAEDSVVTVSLPGLDPFLFRCAAADR